MVAYVYQTVNMQDISQLANFGVAGLAVYLMWKLASNHVAHNTKATQELREAIHELISLIKERIIPR